MGRRVSLGKEAEAGRDIRRLEVAENEGAAPTRAWFNSLEAESIKSFRDLADIFISRFIAGVSAKRKTSYLETVRQRKNQSLREYVVRLNTEALQIPELDESRAVEAMQKGTTSPEFFRSLCRKPPTTLAELMKRAEKYITQDDTLITSRFAREVGDREKQWKKEGRRDKRGVRIKGLRHIGSLEQERSTGYQPLIPEGITPLNASRAEVLMVVQDKDFVQWPKPMKADASRRDPNKYCQYHRTHGHDTNSCYQLISEIERLIKKGHLQNFMKKPEGERPQQNAIAERPCR
ncbi:uncharacterized protein LOC110612597 [Manihot esculenta]|uniref:uncharacterized protein LOC110612597 n=1 Tax=Manihot esculenta TaxID=3983 RepID=UPI000B5D17F6|nr:uncharacterized protein LOC110612597 [Manihot esculenta]